MFPQMKKRLRGFTVICAGCLSENTFSLAQQGNF
jgi:hypothetical protein